MVMLIKTREADKLVAVCGGLDCLQIISPML